MKTYPQSRQFVGRIEATGPSFLKREGDDFLTIYSTVRLISENDQKIFLDNVAVGRHVVTSMAPGSQGVFYFHEVMQGNCWLFAFQAMGSEEVVHDLDGTYRNGSKSFWAAQLLLGIPLAWILTASGHKGFDGAMVSAASEKLTALMATSPFIIIGLLCLLGYSTAQKRLKMLKGLLNVQDQSLRISD